LRRQIFHQHTQGISQTDLAKQFKLGKATVEHWYHQYYVLAYKEIEARPCPSVLGIGEHCFSKKQGYATTLRDLRKHKIFDVVKGRSPKELATYLETLWGREKVEVICIDLSSNYRALIKRYFPNAKIVADRFHVIRLMLQMCMQTYQEIDPKIKNYHRLLAALRTHPDNLTPKRLKRRDDYLAQQPAIQAIYLFKRKPHHLLTRKKLTAKRCKRLIPCLC
jgi:transposase